MLHAAQSCLNQLAVSWRSKCLVLETECSWHVQVLQATWHVNVVFFHLACIICIYSFKLVQKHLYILVVGEEKEVKLPIGPFQLRGLRHLRAPSRDELASSIRRLFARRSRLSSLLSLDLHLYHTHRARHGPGLVTSSRHLTERLSPVRTSTISFRIQLTLVKTMQPPAPKRPGSAYKRVISSSKMQAQFCEGQDVYRVIACSWTARANSFSRTWFSYASTKSKLICHGPRLLRKPRTARYAAYRFSLVHSPIRFPLSSCSAHAGQNSTATVLLFCRSIRLILCRACPTAAESSKHGEE